MPHNDKILDKAINPYRADIAALKLKGKVDSAKFIEPKTFQIKANGVFLKSAPDFESPSVTEALHGEIIEIYEIGETFAWGQLKNDNYVGYIPCDALSDNIIEYSHKIQTLRTYGFKIPKVQGAIISTLSMGALVNPQGEAQNGYLDCGDLGFIYAAHIAPKDEFFTSPYEIAKLYLNSPYTWGGKQSIGVDCSGLSQVAFAACGINLPRDAYMQEEIGQEIAITPDLSGLKANDLVFWKGHVGIMIDEDNFIHANGFHMKTAIEPLKTANERYLAQDLPIRAIRRVINN